MGVIDTHCHLDYLENPASARFELGLQVMVCIGADPEHARNAIQLAETYPEVYATVGLHPTEAAEQDGPELRIELEALSRHPRVVAVGESGLDDHWNAHQRPAQAAAFEWQLDLARRRTLPVIIHTRDQAGNDSASRGCADLLRAAGWHRGILHCCNGHLGLLETGLELGFHVGFAGNVTYKNAPDIQEAARLVPLDRLLIETDAPFLAPVPKRGQQNRPGYARYTLRFIAELRGMSESELEAATDTNARRVYGLAE